MTPKSKAKDKLPSAMIVNANNNNAHCMAIITMSRKMFGFEATDIDKTPEVVWSHIWSDHSEKDKKQTLSTRKEVIKEKTNSKKYIEKPLDPIYKEANHKDL